MTNRNEKHPLQVEIPDTLDQAILSGVRKGKKIMNRKKYITRTLTGTAAVFAIFVGSINVSPALASNLQDVAIVGTLVRTFQWNTPEVKGGHQIDADKVQVKLKKDGEQEQLIFSFDSKLAGRYQAKLAHFPETVTFALPDVQSVQVINAVERAKDASSYIKSIYSFQNGNTLMVQIEFEDTAQIALEEYENPGRIVVNLKQGTFEARDIYSVRTLSFVDQSSYDTFCSQNDLSQARVLRDDQEKLFIEWAQFDTQEQANVYQKEHNRADDLIIEKRWTNNVPVCYLTQQDFKNAQIENEYMQVLQSATEIEPILKFLDQYLRNVEPQVQDTLLRGLTGWIADDINQYDKEELNQYYKIAGQDINQIFS